MGVEFRVISIGALSHNRLWGEGQALRTAHATTTLIVDAERRILVDPSLPPEALAARYNERTGGRLGDVTDVFCTTLRPVHRRGLAALDGATWWAHEQELETYGRHLAHLADSADRLSEEDARLVASDRKLVEPFRPAPEKFSEQVHLYPLAGPSPGSAGLLLTPPTQTVVVAGDAALTSDHVVRGQVWEGCADAEQAAESLRDILEIADVIIPGHDNVILSPRRWV
jgi:glyoxylase-like metal-dependent hydrolase (beta-lactamase superfamily II)